MSIRAFLDGFLLESVTAGVLFGIYFPVNTIRKIHGDGVMVHLVRGPYGIFSTEDGRTWLEVIFAMMI